MKVIGVSRAEHFSPNSVERDAQILNAVAEKLAAMGYHADIIKEEDLTENLSADLVFTMGREAGTLSLLEQLEAQGIVVINSPKGIRLCDRAELTRIMADGGMPHPQSLIIKTDEPIPGHHLSFPLWVKRGNGYSETAADVVFVNDEKELLSALHDFQKRGIRQAVINEHLAGDLIKFYGVSGQNFFRYYYPTRVGEFSKFGWEERNGSASGYAFSPEQLQAAAECLARAIGVDVYGGDCIVAADGSFKIIDFNDWPSFSKCREEAAEAIANHIITKHKGNTHEQ